MPGAPFRFIHASDLHVERPLSGFSQVPEHLQDVLVDAPFRAAEQVFELALTREVDLVVLAGDVLDPRAAGPQGIELVRQQLDRLTERRIAVYWASGTVDREGRWPAGVPLPGCVHRFEQPQVKAVTHRRGDQAVATILGRGRDRDGRIRAADFRRRDEPSAFTIAVCHGAAVAEDLTGGAVDYWALGGKHSACKVVAGRRQAHYSGSPQGRCETEEGPHGCLLVEVDEQRRARCERVPTDVVRWQTEQVELTPQTAQAELEGMLRERARQLGETAGGRLVLVSWSIVDAGQRCGASGDSLTTRLRRGSLADELVSSLRREFGMSAPGVWTVGMEVAVPRVLPSAWYEEDTILGDLLRLIRHYQEHEDEPLDMLLEDASVGRMPPELARAMRIRGPRERDAILRRAAMLGVDLLRGDRVSSEN